MAMEKENNFHLSDKIDRVIGDFIKTESNFLAKIEKYFLIFLSLIISIFSKGFQESFSQIYEGVNHENQKIEDRAIYPSPFFSSAQIFDKKDYRQIERKS